MTVCILSWSHWHARGSNLEVWTGAFPLQPCGQMNKWALFSPSPKPFTAVKLCWVTTRHIHWLWTSPVIKKIWSFLYSHVALMTSWQLVTQWLRNLTSWKWLHETILEQFHSWWHCVVGILWTRRWLLLLLPGFPASLVWPGTHRETFQNSSASDPVVLRLIKTWTPPKEVETTGRGDRYTPWSRSWFPLLSLYNSLSA